MTACPSHLSQVCRSCYFHLRNIGRIHHCLTKEAAATLVHSLVASRVDYANSLLYGLPKTSLARLQAVLNTAARRSVSCTPRFDSISPVLIEPTLAEDWKTRTEYKILILMYKAIHGTAPAYLQDLIRRYRPARALRSQDEILLVAQQYCLWRSRFLTRGSHPVEQTHPAP